MNLPTTAEPVYYTRLPWVETQAYTASWQPTTIGRSASCGWHGTRLSPERGAAALVNTDGPLVDLVEEWVRVTYVTQSAHASVDVLVLDTSGIAEDLSLSRRAFLALTDALWLEELTVTVEPIASE